MNQENFGLNTSSLLFASVIAGLGIGILSHIPVINCVNCLLLGWVWMGGIAAVYLYRSNAHQSYLTTTQGLIIGALAGVIGALVGALMAALFGGLGAAFSAIVSSIAGEQNFPLRDLLFSSGVSFFGTLFNIILYGIFGAIGGLLATTLIWKNPILPQGPQPPYNPPPPGQ